MEAAQAKAAETSERPESDIEAPRTGTDVGQPFIEDVVSKKWYRVCWRFLGRAIHLKRDRELQAD